MLTEMQYKQNEKMIKLAMKKIIRQDIKKNIDNLAQKIFDNNKTDPYKNLQFIKQTIKDNITNIVNDIYDKIIDNIKENSQEYNKLREISDKDKLKGILAKTATFY